MIPQLIHVLLLEDNPDDAALVRELLSEEHAEVFQLEWVDHLQAALNYLGEHSVDVVLCDLNLPDGLGLDAFSKVFSYVPTVPIVILTGTYEERELALKALRQGAQDYLVKGKVDSALLSRVIRYAIERKRVEAELQSANHELKIKLEQVAWLNQIMMEREQRIIELKEENRQLRTRPDGAHHAQPSS